MVSVKAGRLGKILKCFFYRLVHRCGQSGWGGPITITKPSHGLASVELTC